MSVLDELKPITKPRVIDLVQTAGIDVGEWGKFKGGVDAAATNPKYCYEWSFVNPGRVVVLNWWHEDLREQNGVLSVSQNLRKIAQIYRHRLGKGVWIKRAKNFDRAVQEAAANRLPVYLIINDGKRRDVNDPESRASKVARRSLDPAPWSVTSYEPKTGDFTLIRGRYVDQFTFGQASEPAERRTVSGEVFVRNPALRARTLERANGLCEYCDAPGFKMQDGTIFLETHHVIPLGEHGSDSEENLVAVCPNHHREAHHGARAMEMRAELLAKLKQWVSKGKI